MIYVEIRSQPHEMFFEGSHDTRPRKTDIEKAVRAEGFEPFDYDIFFDSFQKFWRFSGHIRQITTAST